MVQWGVDSIAGTVALDRVEQEEEDTVHREVVDASEREWSGDYLGWVVGGERMLDVY
jgi:hypothetical protein